MNAHKNSCGPLNPPCCCSMPSPLLFASSSFVPLAPEHRSGPPPTTRGECWAAVSSLLSCSFNWCSVLLWVEECAPLCPGERKLKCWVCLFVCLSWCCSEVKLCCCSWGKYLFADDSVVLRVNVAAVACSVLLCFVACFILVLLIYTELQARAPPPMPPCWRVEPMSAKVSLSNITLMALLWVMTISPTPSLTRRSLISARGAPVRHR